MFFFKNYPKFVRNKLGTAMFNCVAFKAKILVILSQSFEFEEVNEFEVNPFPISFCITGVEVFSKYAQMTSKIKVKVLKFKY